MRGQGEAKRGLSINPADAPAQKKHVIAAQVEHSTRQGENRRAVPMIAFTKPQKEGSV
jgi:hypothetical protein